MGGTGTRNNTAKRDYVAEHLADVEYRTCARATKADAQRLESQLLRTRKYIFQT